MKKFGLVLSVLALIFVSNACASTYPDLMDDAEDSIHPKILGEKVKFKESWAYVMSGREKYFSASTMDVTDLCYFSADVNSYGELSYIPNPKAFASYKGRIHLVVTCTGRALTHFAIDPKGKCRQGIIDAIAAGSKNYDGVNIDFENVGGRDIENFQLFLKAVREAIGPNKILSVCVPARVRGYSDEIYDYKKMASLTDKVIIMAYDEHWSGGEPGPVASMDWCKRVATYATSVIPREKLVMGLPFYGRSWEDECYGSAWIYSSIQRLINENNVEFVQRKDSVPYFDFDTNVHVTAYYDDVFSLLERCRMYKGFGITNVGFWRIGQEDTNFWKWFETEK